MKRHMFVKGTVRRLSSFEEIGFEIFSPIVCVIIVYFVIVPGDYPGESGMTQLQILVALVASISVPILFKRIRFRTFVLANFIVSPR